MRCAWPWKNNGEVCTLNNWGSIYIQFYFYFWLSYIYWNPGMWLCKNICVYFHKTFLIVMKMYIYFKNFISMILCNCSFTNLSLTSIFTVNIALVFSLIFNNCANPILLLWLWFRTSSIFCSDTFLGFRYIGGIICKGNATNLARLCGCPDTFSAKVWSVSLCKLAILGSTNFVLSVAVSSSNVSILVLYFYQLIISSLLHNLSQLYYFKLPPQCIQTRLDSIGAKLLLLLIQQNVYYLDNQIFLVALNEY